MATRNISPRLPRDARNGGRTDKAEQEQIDDIALAKLVKARENQSTIKIGLDELLDPEEVQQGAIPNPICHPPLSFRTKRGILMHDNDLSHAFETGISPFGRNDKAGLGKVYQLFGDELNSLIDELNESLAA